jgi:uncharacterized protein YceK
VRNLILVGFIFINMLLLGCASVYTGIEKNQDGTYTLTKSQQGFMSLTGSVLNCKEVNEKSIECNKIDDLGS